MVLLKRKCQNWYAFSCWVACLPDLQVVFEKVIVIQFDFLSENILLEHIPFVEVRSTCPHDSRKYTYNSCSGSRVQSINI